MLTAKIDNLTHQLVSAHNCHDTQRFQAKLLGVEVDKPFFRALITKDDIRVNISINVVNTEFLDCRFECCLWYSVLGAIASGVSVNRRAGPIAVNVHVRQLAIDALDVYEALAITAVGISF